MDRNTICLLYTSEKIISIRKIQLEIKEKLQKFESNLIRKKNDLEQLVSENKKKIEDIKEKIKDLENDRINLGMPVSYTHLYHQF